MKFLTSAAVCAATIVSCAGSASAATFDGTFWDLPWGPGESLAVYYAEKLAPTASFTSSAIDYPNGTGGSIDDGTTLATFLGADAATLTGAGYTTLDGSVFRFTGYLDISAGMHTFTISSDDGFVLNFFNQDGTKALIASAGSRAYSSTFVDVLYAADTLTRFELYYYEDYGATGVQFLIDGQIAAPADAPSDVPVPAAGLLLAGALGAFGFARRRKA